LPKLKTNRGAAKRFKRTGTGKLTHHSAFARHILTKKTAKRKRQMRRDETVSANDMKKLNRMLPYL